MGRLSMNEREQAHHRGDRRLGGGRLGRRSRRARRSVAAMARRPSRAPARSPARLLRRRRGQPARSSRADASGAGSATSAHGVRPRDAGVRSRGVGRLRRGGSGGTSGASRSTRTTSGPCMRSCTCARCKAGWTTASASSSTGRPTGGAGTCSPCTTGGTWRCSCSRSARSMASSTSTTPRCTTRSPMAFRWRCSMPARCCGDCCSTATTR